MEVLMSTLRPISEIGHIPGTAVRDPLVTQIGAVESYSERWKTIEDQLKNQKNILFQTLCDYTHLNEIPKSQDVVRVDLPNQDDELTKKIRECRLFPAIKEL